MHGILRPGLLAGVTVALGGQTESELAAGLRSLGAELTPVAGEPPPQPDALVLDYSGWLPAPSEPGTGTDSLQQLLDRAWEATAATANGSFIPARKPGRIVFIAPAQRDQFSAPAVAAALENLSRTLSVEWARHGITACTVAPSAQTSAADLITVVAYLLSPAGAYVSGTRLELDALSG